MAKINIEDGFNNSITKVKANILETSSIEINIGSSRDMSRREIEIIENEVIGIRKEIKKLRELATTAETSTATEARDSSTSIEANKIADLASQIVSEHKWYDVSGKGLLEAAKAVGDVASPLVASAIKVIELLQKARL